MKGIFYAWPDAIESYQSEVVDILIAETGKPMATALYDFGMLVDCLRYFNEEMKRMHGQIISDYDNSHTNLILRKPIGVVAAYLAWNFPLLNVGYKLGPILASGCTCVLKPASITPLSTLLIGRIANEIGFPRGVINIISGPRAVCEAMNRSPHSQHAYPHWLQCHRAGDHRPVRYQCKAVFG